MKTGIVDVGGGLRGIYAAGVFDWCLDQKILFDLCIGVSAGSANVVSYIAGQRGRNYRFYAEYSFRKKYMGIGRFLLKRSFIDLDYVYGTLSNSDGEYPVDYQKVAESTSEMLIVATDARTQKRYTILLKARRKDGKCYEDFKKIIAKTSGFFPVGYLRI